jgi:hypothetical protein
MPRIRDQYLAKYGYTPSDSEILNLYLSGELSLTDSEENELLKYFNL